MKSSPTVQVVNVKDTLDILEVAQDKLVVVDAHCPLQDLGLVLGNQRCHRPRLAILLAEPLRGGVLLAKVERDQPVVGGIPVGSKHKLGSGIGYVLEVVLQLEHDLSEANLALDPVLAEGLQVGEEDQVVPALFVSGNDNVIATVRNFRATENEREV